MTELKVESKLPALKEPKRLDLQGVALAPQELLALPEEVTPEMKDGLIANLISYSGKLDAPARFTTELEAYRYFNLLSEAQVDRLNKKVEEIKSKFAQPKK